MVEEDVLECSAPSGERRAFQETSEFLERSTQMRFSPGLRVHAFFGMTVDRFGNSQDKRSEPRDPAPTAPARLRNRA